MKIICNHTNGNDFNSDQLPMGFFKESQTNLILKKEYLVMGILIYEKYLFYLIDEDSSPFWFPYILFEISDSNVNSKWHFKILENNENTYGEFIYGYFELCFLEGHNDGLMERKENDLRIYFRNKIIMETT